jgi:hypothetical protein
MDLVPKPRCLSQRPVTLGRQQIKDGGVVFSVQDRKGLRLLAYNHGHSASVERIILPWLPSLPAPRGRPSRIDVMYGFHICDEHLS